MLSNRTCKLTNFIFAMLLALFGWSLASSAQPIDPELIRQLQERQQERRTDQTPITQPEIIADPRQLERITAEDLVALSFSRIERDYQDRLGLADERQSYYAMVGARLDSGRPQTPEEELARETLLTQYGYDVYRRPAAPTAPRTGRIPDTYVLGVGDELVVTFVGSTDRSVTVQVDRQGRVNLPNLPPLSASGRQFAAFRADLEQRVSASLIGTQVFVSLADIRSISVFVLGEVHSPGQLSLTNLSSPLEALTAAGGIKKTGSLRKIRVTGPGGEQVLDLYALLASGVGAGISLEEGSTIVVPLIGQTIAVWGDVVRPGIYEISEGVEEVKVSEALALSGGALRPRGHSLVAYTLAETGEQNLVAIDEATGGLRPTDILAVSAKRNALLGSVSLNGHVSSGGRRSLQQVSTLSQLIDGPEALGPTPYLQFAVLETTDPVTLAKILKPVNLERVLAGAEDVNLRDRDALFVLGREDIDFLSSEQVRNVVISGSAMPGACEALRFFAGTLVQTGNDRFSALIQGTFLSRDGVISSGEVEIAEAGAESREIVIGGQSNLTEVGCTELFERRPDLITFVLENGLALTGGVVKPGIYPVADDVTLASLIGVAGGLSSIGDPSQIEVLSFAMGKSTGVPLRRVIDGGRVNLRDIKVQSGSTVRVANQITNQQKGTVLVSGEFLRPGIYAIAKGETLLDIIERAGGLTEAAYPYGAMITRDSVKKEQQESFRRTSREINSALAVAAIRGDSSSESLAAAQSLSRELNTIEALGRIVAEVDPAVLRTKPSLNILIEGGDTFHIPKRPGHILVAGDVLNPSALQYVEGKDIKDYLEEAGGFQRWADKDRVFVVYPNGVAEPVSMSRWSFVSMDLPPGTVIVVPKNLNPIRTMDIVRDMTQILSQLALSAASLAVVADR